MLPRLRDFHWWEFIPGGLQFLLFSTCQAASNGGRYGCPNRTRARNLLSQDTFTVPAEALLATHSALTIIG